MEKHLRLKPYFQLLQAGNESNFIKTLDEGIRFPSGAIFDILVQAFMNYSKESDIIFSLKQKLNITDELSRQLISKMLDNGVAEFYTTSDLPDDAQRYNRQLLLFDSVDPLRDHDENRNRQDKLKQSHVMILGVGGIGNLMALALAAGGVGQITLVDDDIVEESNLNRQVLFSDKNIGHSKADSAAIRLREINPGCEVNSFNFRITSPEVLEKLIETNRKVDYLVLSADKPVDIILWASALCVKHRFKYIKCGYMCYQGLIGPLMGYHTRPYDSVFESWADRVVEQPEFVKSFNGTQLAPSMAATNGILANMAAWELIKDMTGITPSVLTEKRILFNLKTMEMSFG